MDLPSYHFSIVENNPDKRLPLPLVCLNGEYSCSVYAFLPYSNHYSMNLTDESNKPKEEAKSLFDKYPAEEIEAFIEHMVENNFSKELAIRALESGDVEQPKDIDDGKACIFLFLIPACLSFALSPCFSNMFIIVKCHLYRFQIFYFDDVWYTYMT